MKYSLLTFILMLSLPVDVYTQTPDTADLRLRVVCNTPIVEGERFFVCYSVESPYKIESDSLQLKISDNSSATLLARPPMPTSTSTKTNIINGKISETFGIDWNCCFLAAKTGATTLPDAEIIYRGNSYHFPAQPVIEEKQESDKSDHDPAYLLTPRRREDVILRLEQDKQQISSGESLTVTINLLTGAPISNASYNQPFEADDCLYQLSDDDPVHATVTIDGYDYEQYTLAKYTVTPLRSGEFEIKPVELKITRIDFPTGPDLFFSQPKYIDTDVKSDKLTFTVRNDKP